MHNFNAKNPTYPLVGFAIAVLTLVFGLVFVENPNIVYFYIGLYILHLIFGNFKACLVVIPYTAIMASFFAFVTYIVAQDMESTMHAVYRSFAVCFTVIPGLSIPTVNFIKNLRQINLPKGVTLGAMITINFMPLFSKEMKQILSAMKTRGATSILNPQVIYRAFLIPGTGSSEILWKMYLSPLSFPQWHQG